MVEGHEVEGPRAIVQKHSFISSVCSFIFLALGVVGPQCNASYLPPQPQEWRNHCVVSFKVHFSAPLSTYLIQVIQLNTNKGKLEVDSEVYWVSWIVQQIERGYRDFRKEYLESSANFWSLSPESNGGRLPNIIS